MVYTLMVPGEDLPLLGNWLRIHFTTNPGMAFGIELGGSYGKILLSLFRLTAIVFIGFYIRNLFNRKAHPGLICCIALIFGGAVGNMIDSTFYGFIDEQLLVDSAPVTLFHGMVIDMIYIYLGEGYYPESWPMVGGGYYNFWPIFNVADSSIFLAVIIILIRQKAFFKSSKVEGSDAETVQAE